MLLSEDDIARGCRRFLYREVTCHAGKKRKQSVRRFCTSLCTLVLLYLLYTAVSIWNYSGKSEHAPVDAIIVLGAGVYKGEVSPVFRERIHHGISLYQKGMAKKIIFTGGYSEGSTQSDAAIAKHYAKARGVPAEDILCEEKSTITQENIQYAKEIMAEQGYQSAIIVSDPLHMKRAMLMAEDAGIKAYSSPTPTIKVR